MVDIEIILVKADYCRYCKMFLPIYEKTTEKGIKELPSTKFHIMEMDENVNPNAREKFVNKYGNNLLQQIEGYPTVFIKLSKDNKDLFATVEHTMNKNGKDSGEKEAIELFKENILNAYKTLNSDGKDEYLTVQTGGNLIDIQYKRKYLKYKEKYLKLKHSL
jgi:thiol-disulfide isomerase/thioredoxin